MKLYIDKKEIKTFYISDMSVRNKNKDETISQRINKYISSLGNCKNEKELAIKTSSYLLNLTNSQACLIFSSTGEKNLFKSNGIILGKRKIKCDCIIDANIKNGKEYLLKNLDLRKELIKSNCKDINLVSGHKYFSTFSIKGANNDISLLIELLKNESVFKNDELKISSSIVAHSQRILRNIERHSSYEEYAKKLKILNETIHIINDSHNLNELAEKIEPVMRKAIPYDSIVFATYDDSERYIVDLYIMYHEGVIKRNNLYAPTSIGKMKKELRKKKTIRIDDLSKNPFGLARIATLAEGMSSELIVGCISKGKILGVFVLVKKEKNFYTDEDEWFMRMIAKDITSAMVRFKTDEILRKQKIYSEISNKIIQKTLKSENAEKAAINLFSEIEKKLDFDTLKVGLFNNDLSEITIYLKPGNNKKLIGPQTFKYDEKRHKKVIDLLQSKRRYISADSEIGKSLFSEKVAAEENLQSAIIFPLSLPKRLLGFIAFLSKKKNIFGKHDIEGIALIAESFSLALENLLLKNEADIQKKNWESTFNSISDYILIIDRNGKILRLNKKSKKLLKKISGNDYNELSAKDFLNALKIPYAQSLKELVFKENLPVNQTLPSINNDKYYNILIDPIRKKSSKKCQEAVLQVKDITDIKKTEAELKNINQQYRKQNTKFKALSKIAEIINRDKTPQEIFEMIGKEVKRIIPFDSGKVWVFNKESKELDSIYTLTIYTEKFSASEAMKTGLQQSSVMEILKSGKPMIRNLKKGNPSYREDRFIKEANINSVLYIPLEAKEKITGCISLGSRRYNAFTTEDISFMKQIAGYISSYLENLKLLSELMQANIEWEKTFNSTSDYIFLTDSKNNIIKCNKSFQEDYLREETFLEKKCYEIFCKKNNDKNGCIHRKHTPDTFPNIFEFTDQEKGRTFVVSISPIGIFSDKKECYVHIVTDITKMKEAEKTILNLATQLNTVFENSPDGMILMDKEQKIVKFSKSAQKILGVDLSKENWNTRQKFLQEKVLSVRRSDNTPIPFNELPITTAYRTGKEIKNQEIIFEYKDGRKQYLLIHILPLKNSKGEVENIVSIFKDITQQKEYEETLRKQTDELNNIFTSFQDALILVNDKGKILKMNSASEKLFEIDSENEVFSKELFLKRYAFFDVNGELIPFEELPLYRAIKEGISTKNKEATLLIDGKIKKTIMMNAIAFKNNNGEVYSALGVYSDITEKKILEAKLLQSEKLSSLGTMAAGIAHELNNPLQGIAGFSELLLNEKCNEKQMEKIKLINEQAERASSIIKDLLIFSRQKAEEQKPSNINKLIEQAVKMVSYGFKNHQIDIEVNLLSDIPIIDVYENRIVQIFINILKNSYQNMIVHNPKGKITIKTSVENKTPFLKIKSDCKKVLKISIEDEGSGIERAVINKIFDPFFSTTESKENIGLGLSITYSIVKEHDGDIIISSEKGKGTKTEIYLPIPDPKKSPFAAEKPQIYKKDGMITTTAGMVLIISDDRNVGKNFSELKGRHPINITFAENEEDAIKKITNEYFHLIICDIDTKAINPGNLYKRTIKIKKNLSDKFIFTGDGELNPNARRFINLTGCPYLQKPLSQKTVRNVFHKLIDIESLQ